MLRRRWALRKTRFGHGPSAEFSAATISRDAYIFAGKTSTKSWPRTLTLENAVVPRHHTGAGGRVVRIVPNKKVLNEKSTSKEGAVSGKREDE